MDKNTWLEALNKETRENAEFAYLWTMAKTRVECGINTYPVCKVEDAIAVASSEFQKACKERRKTRNASANRRMRDDAMRSCGLTKVYGSVSGKVYWE